MALDMNVASAVVNHGQLSSLDDLGPLTYAVWVKAEAANLGGVMIDKGTGAGGNRRRLSFDVGTNQIEFRVDGTTADLKCEFGSAYTVGEWAFFAATWDGNDSVNGLLYTGDFSTVVTLAASTNVTLNGLPNSNGADDVLYSGFLTAAMTF